MSLARVFSRASLGIEAPLITVEVHLANGLPAFQLVGLPEASVRESRERVRSALINSGFEFPAKRITVNLAPADLPKEGGRFDLAIAIGIIAACGHIDKTQLEQYEFLGELALGGEIRPIVATLPSAYACAGCARTIILSGDNAAEACLVEQAKVLAAENLVQVYLHLCDKQRLELCPAQIKPVAPAYQVDMCEIRGQKSARRALEIAAAGGHNLLLTGPPGSGKTMLASRFMTILPDMTEQQAFETATIHSILGKRICPQSWRQRHFRQPHHTSSAVALVGGGSIPRPGEISLAHNSVLFLDELPEFERRVLDVLREPLESGEINISRSASQARFPARFQLIAAMNPSPTGSVDDQRSSPEQILRYLGRISGPLLDRIDLQVDVPRQAFELSQRDDCEAGESSQTVRQRVEATQQRQRARHNKLNARLSPPETLAACQLSDADGEFFKVTVDKLGLSMRACYRALKVSRTIADMDQQDQVSRAHIAEALSYRALDRLLRQLVS